MSLASSGQQHKRPLRAPVAPQPTPPIAARAATPQAVPRRAPVDPAVQALVNTITTLEAVVEEETAALKSRQQVDLDAFSNRKSQGLLELNRSMKQLDAMRGHQVIATRLASLREKLAANQAALQLHLEAVREISSIIANAIRESESDGTYSEAIRRPEAAYGYD